MSQYKIKIAAQAAQDATGKTYDSYLIPEPKTYQAWRDELKALNARPRSDIGANPDAQAPARHGSIVLKRGGQPVDLEVGEELLKQLQSDKKNLLIFDVSKVDSSGAKEARR